MDEVGRLDFALPTRYLIIKYSQQPSQLISAHEGEGGWQDTTPPAELQT